MYENWRRRLSFVTNGNLWQKGWCSGTSFEASFVRMGIWKYYDVGWLFSIIRGKKIWLAKYTPKGVVSLRDGDIDIHYHKLNIRSQYD